MKLLTKLKAQKWALFSALGLTSLLATTALGGSSETTFFLTASLALPAIMTALDPRYSVPKMHALLSLAAYLKTFSLRVSGLTFFSAPIMVIGSTLSGAHMVAHAVIINHSNMRVPNLENDNELWLKNTIDELSKKANVKIQNIKIIDILSKLNDDNIEAFRAATKKYYSADLNKLEHAQFIIKLKEILFPQLQVTQNLKQGNEVWVFSNLFDYKNGLFSKENIKSMIAHELGHADQEDYLIKCSSAALYNISVFLGIHSLQLPGLALAGVGHAAYYGLLRNIEKQADCYSAQQVSANGLMDFFEKMDKLEKDKEKETNIILNSRPSILTKLTRFYKAWSMSHPASSDRLEIVKEFVKELR